MAPIIKLTKNIEIFLQIKECQKAWELIKQKYIEASILISPNQQVEFHVHIDASLLAVGAILSLNAIGKSDQLVMYAFRLLNITKQNYNTIKKEVLTMVLLCTNSYIICSAISLFFMQIIWHWSIWSTNHRFQGE